MTESKVLDLAQRLWPQVRDQGHVADPSDLDLLLATQGQAGAFSLDTGVRGTFAAFAADTDPEVTLSTGEHVVGDEARFIGHLAITRVLLGAGLHVDPRVQRAMGDAYALTWCTRGPYAASPLMLATSMWLVALDPLSRSDRPLEIDWTPEAYQDPARWDLEYRLFSHYDIRERALDWAMYASVRRNRHPGCSIWTIVEPLLRLADDRASQALAAFGGAREDVSEPIPAAAMLERGRIEALLRGFTAQARQQRRASG